MPRSPYMNFPFPFYKNKYNTPPFQYDIPQPSQYLEHTSIPSKNNSSSSNLNEKNKSNKYTDDYLFDLFGLKIYNDDILLVSLIYFLYSEGVKDDGLFLVLILLLLS